MRAWSTVRKSSPIGQQIRDSLLLAECLNIVGERERANWGRVEHPNACKVALFHTEIKNGDISGDFQITIRVLVNLI